MQGGSGKNCFIWNLKKFFQEPVVVGYINKILLRTINYWNAIDHVS